MTIADITLAAFTLSNSLRVVAYVPQIAKAFGDRGGAQAISFGTWSPLPDLACVGDGLRVRQQGGRDDGFHVPAERHRLCRNPARRGLEARAASRSHRGD